jgi:hypothetical protein
MAGAGVAIPHDVWPFPYAPPFLLVCRALALLPLPAAYLAWIVASGAALAASAKHWASPLLILSPAVFYAILAGQTSCVVGALMFEGLFLLAQRPRLAGALLAMAALIKPQFVFLAPLGLIVACELEALLTMAAVGVAACLVATLALGVGIWSAWLGGFPVAEANYAFVHPHLTLQPTWLWAVGLVAGLGLMWSAFRRDDSAARHLACAGTAILCGPHALWYDAAVLAPASAHLMRLNWRAGPSLIFLVLWPRPWTVVVAMLSALRRPAMRLVVVGRAAQATSQP